MAKNLTYRFLGHGQRCLASSVASLAGVFDLCPSRLVPVPVLRPGRCESLLYCTLADGPVHGYTVSQFYLIYLFEELMFFKQAAAVPCRASNAYRSFSLCSARRSPFQNTFFVRPGVPPRKKRTPPRTLGEMSAETLPVGSREHFLAVYEVRVCRVRLPGFVSYVSRRTRTVPPEPFPLPQELKAFLVTEELPKYDISADAIAWIRDSVDYNVPGAGDRGRANLAGLPAVVARGPFDPACRGQAEPRA
jgi:hypothetical protein